ncbi:probable L-type lectin-domain containing receptor kinase S.7 [Neltuma alba]|uniref:probable L-type lectin-domain containing receptor kinase S.7 n=1 Tax=Neltuma alba TaxID=207710 RepID=UPI0010A4860D|nr:probable L-type lectin-domain containing receptor kinase S.7 [Prosopis alba]
MCSGRTLVLFFLSCFLDPTGVLAQNLTFEFSSFTSLRNVTLVGDSFLRNGVVGLTRSSDVPTSSAGAVIYNDRISLFDPHSNASSSFSTSFAFSITDNLNNPPSLVDGSLSFFLFPSNHTLWSIGGKMGLLNSSQLTRSNVVAVEFVPSDNRVELGLNGVASINTTGDTISQGIDLKSGELITAWIDYESEKRKLQVFLSYNNSTSNFKPENPVLNVDDLDLSGYIKEIVYVGFAASAEGSTELHQLVNWRFQSNGSLPATPPKFHAHNVSGSWVSATVDIHNKSYNHSSNKHDKRLGLGIAIAGPAFFCVVLVSLGYFSVRKWRNGRTLKRVKTDLMSCPREFSYKELKVATKGFHSSRIIGQGSFGTVYKALFLPSGAIAAVKRSRQSHDGKTEFLAELSIIAGLRHKNLVQLQGWCVDKGELLLVYDFMPNGSLDKMLYPESEGSQNLLNWSRRLNIAIGLASVLTYLHKECEKRVIHRDIKTGNILLDANYNPRLGDFGLAKLMDHDRSPVSTLTAGTMGYLAPEYLQYGMATEKTDVFSYGVVVLEVACGRRPIEREGQNMVNLVDWVWGFHSQGKIVEAADKRLNGEFTEKEMKKLLLLGLSCANPDSAERPSMTRVLQILSNDEPASTLVVPKVKPCLTFSCGLPLSLDEIVSDSDVESSTEKSLCEIRIG